jgi:hypothetical protein
MTRPLSFAATMLVALVVSGCEAGTPGAGSTPPPAASHPATTTAPSNAGATRAEREAEHEPAAEKAHRQKMVQEVIAGCAACRDRSSGPPPKSPAKEREAAEKANERRGEEATRQAHQIEEYKAAKRAAK